MRACNFNSEASVDNGTCHFNCLFCNDGTVWNEVTQGCDVANPLTPTSTGVLE